MTRQEFLNTLGLGAAFVLTTSCLQSCAKDPSTTVDFTLDLTNSAYAALKTNGNYIIYDNVVVARTTTGSYVAATLICSHQGQPQVTYDKTGNRFYCTAHGALYNLSGVGLNQEGANGLTIYKTTLTGTSLHVYS
jgi:Rieske Fe-S protein